MPAWKPPPSMPTRKARRSRASPPGCGAGRERFPPVAHRAGTECPALLHRERPALAVRGMGDMARVGTDRPGGAGDAHDARE